VFSLSDKFF